MMLFFATAKRVPQRAKRTGVAIANHVYTFLRTDERITRTLRDTISTQNLIESESSSLQYQCDYVTVQCPFRGCDVSGTPREIKTHHDTCPHFVVRCPLRQDCDFYCVRQEMWKHVWFTEIGSLLVAVLMALAALALGYLVLPKIMYYGYLAGCFFAEMLYSAFHYLYIVLCFLPKTIHSFIRVLCQLISSLRSLAFGAY